MRTHSSLMYSYGKRIFRTVKFLGRELIPNSTLFIVACYMPHVWTYNYYHIMIYEH